jgi:lysine 2,3-aminomutase
MIMTMAHQKKTKSPNIHGFKAFVEKSYLSAHEAQALQNSQPLLEASITQEMADLLPKDKTTWATDPIAQQFIPTLHELDLGEGTLKDPLGDFSHMPVKGIVHRHEDRCLLLPIAICALYCRFCFRKEQIGPGHKALTDNETQQAIDYIAQKTSIFEVILSGGDPLMLNPSKLDVIFKALQNISHVKVIRIHTRIPVVDSKRITEEFLSVCKQVKPLYIVLHINHANELHAGAREAILKLQENGVHLLSQSVLLKGVNDTVEALESLMRELVILGVKPYYIHQLDPARGVEHFRVDRSKGLALMEALRKKCSGLCQPLYVEDVPDGQGAKMPVKEKEFAEEFIGKSKLI